MNSQNLTIGILDDHDLVRNGLETLIHQTDHYHMVFSESTSAGLYTYLQTNTLDILLLDIDLKDESGISILKKLKQDYPGMKVIMLTIHEEPSFIHHCVTNGADGYIVKSTPFDELIQTVQKVVDKGSFFEEPVANLYIKDHQKLRKLEIDGIPISSDERELIRLLEKGLTAKEISKILLKGDRTIEGYKSALLKKTGCKNVIQLIGWAYRNKIL